MKVDRRSGWILATAVVLGLVCGRGVFAADAILSWSPNTESDLAGYRVHYGTTSGVYPNVIDVGLVTAYTVTGLGPGTYYFTLTAYNLAGAESAFSNQGSKLIADTQPPGISGVAVGGITSTAATVTWTTSEPATSWVEYGTGTTYGLRTTENLTLAGSHQHQLTGLQASTLYHYRVVNRDSAGNLAVSADRTFTTLAAADTTAPTISAVAATTVTSTGATVTWTTNEAATTQVQYGTTTAYGFTTALNSTLLTAHNQALTGLAASTTYNFRVLSRDADGNLATSANFTVRTLAAADATAPSITAVAAGNVTSTGATVTWITNEAATTQVQYGLTTAYGATTGLNSTLVIAHAQALSGLAAATTYHYRVISRDAAGNTATSVDQTFRTALPAARVTFAYPSRSALLADGWSYIAKTAAGANRNTEQSGSLAVNYSQTTHPGTIRIPLGRGQIWQGKNNSQNMLLRTLPSNWTSIRLKVAAFSPVADYQQVDLLAYQDDDNYVAVYRNHAGSPRAGFVRELRGATTGTDQRPLTNTGNLILRLDRAPATNTYRAYYSTNDGATWVQLTGAPTQTLTNPRLAIQIGANNAGTLPTADVAWVEILQ
ncbi:MAG: fibronectin type III domain-containing protein [Nitrospirota bacterium]